MCKRKYSSHIPNVKLYPICETKESCNAAVSGGCSVGISPALHDSIYFLRRDAQIVDKFAVLALARFRVGRAEDR